MKLESSLDAPIWDDTKNGDLQEHIANLERNSDAPTWGDSRDGDLQKYIANFNIFVNLEIKSDEPI